MTNKHFIYCTITELLGCTVIWSKQNGPKPKKPFASLRLYAFRGVGMGDETPTDTLGEVEIRNTVEATLEVQYFGTNAEQKLIEMNQALSKPTVLDKCFSAGVAFFDAQNVQDLTGLLDAANYEERASIDLYVRFTMSTIDMPGYIEKVIINTDGEILEI